ncbi:MAG: CopG family transcriptional regulator [Deltaproteobacteria bacterium]|nr:CopG family transcriptional regulator [Deltaproteobacteria bacterium]
MEESQTTKIQTDIPIGLLAEAQSLVKMGWFRNLDEMMIDALRRYVESHRSDMMEEFIRQDVEWGLKGDE